MKTVDMYNMARYNSKTYTCKLGEYSKEDGFILDEEAMDNVNGSDTDGGMTFEEFADWLLDEADWKIKEQKKVDMTLKDIEKELGYKINLIDEKKDTDHYDALRRMLWGF